MRRKTVAALLFLAVAIVLGLFLKNSPAKRPFPGGRFLINCRVIDQYGDPVPGHQIEFCVFSNKGEKDIRPKTDARGEVKFDSGDLLVSSVLMSAKGQVMNQEVFYTDSNDEAFFYYKSPGNWREDSHRQGVSPIFKNGDTFVFHVGRSDKPEPLRPCGKRFEVPISSPAVIGINTTTGLITLGSVPAKGVRIEVWFHSKGNKNGPAKLVGLVEGLDGTQVRFPAEEDYYQQEAPPDGYQESLDFSPSWDIDRRIFFKASAPENFGLIAFHAISADQNRKMFIDVALLINPRGSRNLNDGERFGLTKYSMAPTPGCPQPIALNHRLKIFDNPGPPDDESKTAPKSKKP